MGMAAFYNTQMNEADAHALFQHLIDIGQTHWDSADIYGFGLSESYIGSFFKKHGQREKVFVATKVGCVFALEGGTEPAGPCSSRMAR